jgi:hypothetical protein
VAGSYQPFDGEILERTVQGFGFRVGINEQNIHHSVSGVWRLQDRTLLGILEMNNQYARYCHE